MKAEGVEPGLWETPYDCWNAFVKEQLAKPGWKLKMNDIDNLCGDFYYDRPPTFTERLFKTYIPTLILHADLDTDYDIIDGNRHYPITITKRK